MNEPNEQDREAAKALLDGLAWETTLAEDTGGPLKEVAKMRREYVARALAAARQAAEQRAERLRGVIASTVNTLTVFPAPSGSTVILLMHDLQDALREDAARGEQDK